MKVQIEALVVRDKDTNELLDVNIIDDPYCETGVTYPAGYVTLDEIKEYAQKLWGDNAEKAAANIISAVAFGRSFYLQHEAKDLPSLGRVAVRIETKEIEWE